MQKKYILLLVVFLAIYIGLSYMTPLNEATLAKYHLSATEARLLGITIIIPVVVIWYLAFLGFSKLKEYAKHIASDQDGKSLDTLASGLMVMAIGMPIVSIASEAVGYFSATRLDLVPKAVMVSNYLSIAVSLWAFTWIFKGALGLAKIPGKKFSEVGSPLFILPFAALSAVYVYFALTSSVKSLVATATTHGTYYLPDWLIVSTVLVPLVFVWYLGLRSASFIAFYQKTVSGTIYKQGLNLLSLGVVAVVLSSIVEQVLTLLSSSLNSLSTKGILALIYALLALIGIGFLFIAQGANKLRKIEES